MSKWGIDGTGCAACAATVSRAEVSTAARRWTPSMPMSASGITTGLVGSPGLSAESGRNELENRGSNDAEVTLTAVTFGGSLALAALVPLVWLGRLGPCMRLAWTLVAPCLRLALARSGKSPAPARRAQSLGGGTWRRVRRVHIACVHSRAALQDEDLRAASFRDVCWF